MKARFPACLCGVLLFLSTLFPLYPFDYRTSLELETSRDVVLTIPERGWYSFRTKSDTGSGLTLVDRMAGVIGSHAGSATTDGRIDRLLEPGEYRVTVRANASGTAGRTTVTGTTKRVELQVSSFRERNADPRSGGLPYLSDGDYIRTDLLDMEVRSYWIAVEKDRPLFLELAGRNLTSCSLWQDGRWLLDLKFTNSWVEPVSGKPLSYFEYAGTLPEGIYQLQCAGGPARPWPVEDGSNRFYIRRGARYLGTNNSIQHTISDIGLDYFLVNGNADYYHLNRKDIKPSGLFAGRYSPNANRGSSRDRSASISKDSKVPYCNLEYSNRGGKVWLAVQGTPGDTVTITFFDRVDSHSFSAPTDSGRYWVSSLHAGGLEDFLDNSAVVIRTKTDGSGEVLAEQAVHLKKNTPLVRNVNLFSETSMIVYVEDPGDYRIFESAEPGARARYRFVRLDGGDGDRYVEYQRDEGHFNLVRGLYVLQIAPERSGILSFVLQKGALFGGKPRKDFFVSRAEKPSYRILWEDLGIPVGSHESVSITTTSSSNFPLGLTVRRLPVNLDEPLAFPLLPGDRVTVPVEAGRTAILGVGVNPQGTGTGAVALLLDGVPVQAGDRLPEGRHTLTVTSTASSDVIVSLSSIEIRSPAPSGQPVFAPFPTDRVLSPGAAQFAEYERGERRQFLLRVDSPALYRMETTGRLATKITVRTSTVTSLFNASENGVARNALVETYLKPGEYLVEVTTLGASRGRAGLVLGKTPLIDGGAIEPDQTARSNVAPDEALWFGFSLPQADTCSIETLGLGNSFEYRLEDADGWPVVTRNTGTFRGLLPGGKYRYMTYPKAHETRRLTSLTLASRSAPARPDDTVLRLNQRRDQTWKERNPRTPDVYSFSLGAPLEIRFELPGEFEGAVLDRSGTKVLSLNDASDGSPSPARLPAGEYTVQVTCREKNNGQRYTIGLFTDELAPGMTRFMPEIPGSVTVSIATGGIYDLWSYGAVDVKAELFDPSGARVAVSDDSLNDWNFRISRRFEPGIYSLQVGRIGDYHGSVRVSLAERSVIAKPAGGLPFSYAGDVSRSIVEMPFTTGRTPELVSFRNEGEGPVYLALYRDGRFLASGTDALEIPLRSDTRYTLHAWHDLDTRIALRVRAAVRETEKAAFEFEPVTRTIPSALNFRNPKRVSHIYRVLSGALLYSPGLEQPCMPLDGLPKNTAALDGWLVNAAAGGESSVYVYPYVIEPGIARTMVLDGTVQSFVMAHTADEILVLEAESPGCSVGLEVLPAGSYRPDTHVWQGMSTPGESTFIGIPGKGEYQGKVWPVLEADRATDRRVVLRAHAFPVTRRSALSQGAPQTVTLRPGEGCVFTLPNEPQKLDVYLSKGLTALLWEEGRPVGTSDARYDNLRKTAVMYGGSVSVVNRSGTDALLRIGSVPSVREEPRTLAAGTRYEEVLPGGGTLQFRNGVTDPASRLCVAGPVTHAELAGDDGTLYRGTRVEAGIPMVLFPAVPGMLSASLERGYLSVFLTTEAGALQDLLEVASPGPQRLAQSVRLSGRPQVWEFVQETDGFVRLETDTPGMTAILSGGKVISAAAGTAESDRTIFRFLEAGTYRVFTRPFRGGDQNGGLVFTRALPVPYESLAGDGQSFIAPDEADVYSFDVRAQSMVGLGIEQPQELLQAELYDRDFRLLEAGPLLFNDLSPGRYYVIVRGTAKPMQYRLRVLGAEGSREGVPQEEVKRYREGR